jgi:polyphenol oxidase
VNSMSNIITPDWPAPANVNAAITTRDGGVSQSVYRSNNLARHVGDNPAHVDENRRQLCATLGLTREPQWLEQIHGVKVVAAQSDGLVRTADGCYSNEPGQACTVLTADCLPVLLCDRAGTEVAAIHAGWKGLAKGILARGVGRFKAPASELLAYLGPAISQPAFEVGIDVLEAFFKGTRNDAHADAIAAAFQPAHRPMRFFADIYALAQAELNALGVTAIYGGGSCTYADEARFYSFRRDNVTGRMASVIWLAE